MEQSNWRRRLVFEAAGFAGGAAVVAAWLLMIEVASIQTHGAGLLMLLSIFGPAMGAAAVGENRMGYHGVAVGMMVGFVWTLWMCLVMSPIR